MHLLPTSLAKNLFLKSLSGLRAGWLELISGADTWEFGDRESTLRATVVVHNERFFRRAVLGGIAAVSAALLMTELALTRIFSVTMYYHFAFLAISIALFGLSASGVFVLHFGSQRTVRFAKGLKSRTRIAIRSVALAAGRR